MNDQSLDALRTDVAAAVEQDEGLRKQVRDLTLQALKEHSMDLGEVRRVAEAVTQGISLGLEHRKGELKNALSEAMAGLDEAVSKAAEASHLALRQLVSQGKEFGKSDLKQALEQLKNLEGAFLDTLSTVADSAGDKLRQEFKDFVLHARRAGTDTGGKISVMVEEFSNKVHATGGSGKLTTVAAARDVGGRVAEVASGFFSALSDALHEKSKK